MINFENLLMMKIVLVIISKYKHNGTRRNSFIDFYLCISNNFLIKFFVIGLNVKKASALELI